ncbi:ParB/RepB/Spo0J family partition protein [Candidatus Saccharibacteria bacterium]|nr:ParB/RepB/Spo0J family partition protein [Candidatus Saccharibacteria bacterium]
MSKFGLGRDFESLIPTELKEFDPTADLDRKDSEYKKIKLSDIVPDPDQPRRHFNDEQLEALADSIKEHGVLQPIVVTKEGKKYKIVTGERRWRASKIAGKDTIPAIVRSIDAQNRLELELIENVQREDLNAIEIATAYYKLKEQFNLEDEEVAKKIGKSKTAVINTMRLLNLPDKAKHLMLKHKLTEGQMRPLINATEAEIDAVLPKIIEEHWPSRKVEQYMVKIKAARKVTDKEERKALDAAFDKKIKSIEASTGLKVKVHTNTKGAGNLTLKFKNQEEFEKICSMLTTLN